MTRVTHGTVTKKRHKKVIKLAKGYKWGRGNLFRLAKNAVTKAGTNAYRDRRLKKRTFRQLWITRISIFLRAKGLRYSEFINKFSSSNIFLNRKMLSDLAVNYPDVMDKVIKKVG